MIRYNRWPARLSRHIESRILNRADLLFGQRAGSERGDENLSVFSVFDIFSTIRVVIFANIHLYSVLLPRSIPSCPRNNEKTTAATNTAIATGGIPLFRK